MTAGEILGAIVLVTLHSGKVVDITDMELDGTILTKEQLEELPAADIERCCREYHVMLYTQSIAEMMEETAMQLEKMVYMEYREPLELEEQQDCWNTLHEYSKCKRGSTSKPYKNADYWHRVRSFCVRRNYH